MKTFVAFYFVWHAGTALIRLGYAMNARFPIRQSAISSGQHLFGSCIRVGIACWAGYLLLAA